MIRTGAPTPAAGDRPLLRLDRLTKVYGAVTALDGLTVEVPRGCVGVVGANAAELAQAAGLGLAEAPDEPVRAEREPRVQKVVQQVVKEVVVERQVEVAVPAQAAPTVYVDKPLRSGQQVYAKGADLVVLAAVNHGAEVIADGSIHVYAPLRGKAIAGARGNAQARIFAQQLEAELIAIAGIYRTSENPLPDNVRGKAAQVRLDGEKLLMEPLGA